MYLLDSNILIGFLNDTSKEVDWITIQQTEGRLLAVSVITKVEILSLNSLTEEKILVIEEFLNLFSPMSLNDETISVAASLRRRLKIPLADSIIAATAILRKMTLVTNDKVLAKKVEDLVKVLSLS